jgi:hypothetical protein
MAAGLQHSVHTPQRTRRGAIDEAFQKKQREAFATLHDKAAEKGIVILRTPPNFAMAPAKNGQVVPPFGGAAHRDVAHLHALPQDRRAQARRAAE